MTTNQAFLVSIKAFLPVITTPTTTRLTTIHVVRTLFTLWSLRHQRHPIFTAYYVKRKKIKYLELGVEIRLIES